MASGRKINIWYDREGDFLDVTWGRNTSTEPTKDDRVMAHVDDEGNIQGFHIVGVCSFEGKFVDLEIEPIDSRPSSV